MKRISVLAFAQKTYYASARSGLSMREQPSTSAKVLGVFFTPIFVSL